MNGNNIICLRVTKDQMVNYCSLIINPSTLQAIAVDPAWEYEKISKVLRDVGANLAGVLLTHHHSDHIDLAKTFSTIHNAPIYMSEIESRTYSYNGDRVNTFTSGEVLELAGLQVMPILTPGHTAGSTCYLVEQSLFTGDTLFNEGCGMCYGRGANPVDMFHSLRKIVRSLHDGTRIFPGHRYYSELGKTLRQIKQMNVYLNFDDVDKFVSFRMRKNSRNNAFQFL